MRILFCQAMTYPFIGIMSISSVLKMHGHETRLKIFNINNPKESDFDEILAYRPDVVAFPAYTGWQRSIINFCRELKERSNVITILGGPHPTYYPKVLKNAVIDYICVGEGEVSLPKLLDNLQNKKQTEKVPGIWYKNGDKVVSNGPSELPDIQSLPPMDIDLYCDANDTIRSLGHREFSTNRGCPFKCTYCNEPSLNKLYNKRNLRTKTPDQAIDEILHVHDKYPMKTVAFTSDNLFIKKDFVLEFLEKYKAKVNIPFYCQMRLELVTPELARLYKESNCHLVIIGLESGSHKVRKEILGRRMTNEFIINACRTLQDAGLRISTNSMVGIPGETVEEAWETVKINQEIRPNATWCSIFQPYPATEITEKLLKSGEIKPDVFDNIPGSYFERSVLKTKDIHVLVNLHRFFYFAVKYPRLQPIIKLLCRLKTPYRLYDIFFVVSFCMYVKQAYRKSYWNAITRVATNALEAIKA